MMSVYECADNKKVFFLRKIVALIRAVVGIVNSW